MKGFGIQNGGAFLRVVVLALVFTASLGAGISASAADATSPEVNEYSAPSRNGGWNPAIPHTEPAAPAVELVSVLPAATNALPETPAAASSDNSQHIIKVGDVIDVKVFQEDDLSGRSRVTQDGAITLPLLGQVKVAGMSMDAATRQVHKLLADDYLVSPRVLITLVETTKPRFTILGQVQAPGMYELAEGEEVGLLQAISLAGGYTRLANPSRITLKRTVAGGEFVRQFDGKALAKGRNAKVERIQPGDTIYVAERVF